MTARINLKRRWFGRATEARFIADASSRGLIVSRPFTEAPGYDAVIDNGRRLIRVQIKGCTPNCQGVCTININRHRRAVPKYDILVVWVTSIGRWLFIPGATRRRQYLHLRVGGKWSRAGWETFTK
jgi:hypothetical protein